ncbi:MAG: hypothetical protein PHS07_01790 [Patescibacteria group bacterium]|nr:hypothetical protein [Patescibacteria group bacterium]
MENNHEKSFLVYQPENKDLSPEKVQLEIESLGLNIQEILELKAQTLENIQQDTQSQDSMNVKDRRAKQGERFVDFKEKENIRQVDLVETKKGFYFEYRNSKGEKQVVSESEMITDMEWGVYYDLNHQIVSKEIYQKYNTWREKYTQAYFDKLVRDKKDRQLILQRLFVDNVGQQDLYLAQAYESLLEGKDERKAGFVFEKMIQSTLKKISLDLGEEWGLEYIEADVVDDVEFKTDCILKIEDKHHRATGVEEISSDTKRKGIQLTLKKSGQKEFDDKKRQVESVKKKLHQHGLSQEMLPIDDLVLLSVDVDNPEIMDKYNQWQKDHQKSGGPEKIFKPQRLMEILSGIFQDSALDFNQNDEFKKVLLDYFDKQGYGKN